MAGDVKRLSWSPERFQHWHEETKALLAVQLEYLNRHNHTILPLLLSIMARLTPSAKNESVRTCGREALNTRTFAVMIYTLGRFSLVVDGVPVTFSTRAQKRPLDLLKALIARGGRGVSEDYLCEDLWPDFDGVSTHRVFATTLHRLRKILGHTDAITCQNGRYNLNPRYCWIDLWEFERSVNRALSMSNSHRREGEDYPFLLEQSANMYHSAFLEHDCIETWATAMRERLRSKFVRCIRALGQYHVGKKQYKQAIDVYERGNEIHHDVAEFHRELLLCRQAAGHNLTTLPLCPSCYDNIKHYSATKA